MPDEQSMVHGDELQELLQLPAEQLHVLPLHAVLCRDVGVPGSEMAGPPFGEPPSRVPTPVPPDPPHAPRETNRTEIDENARILDKRKAPCWTGHAPIDSVARYP